VLAQLLDVGHQQRGRVVGDFAQRRRTAGAALVEYDDAVVRRIKKAAVRGGSTGARAAMQEQHRRACGIAGLFEIHAMSPVEGQHAGVIGFDLGVQRTAQSGSVHFGAVFRAMRRGERNIP